MTREKKISPTTPFMGANKRKPVKIPPNVAELSNLVGVGGPFCLVKAMDKIPLGKGWQLPENQYHADDPRLLDHLRTGGNYGVCGGNGLVIIDIDNTTVLAAVVKKLEQLNTFTVSTPGGGLHFYVLCNELAKPIRLRDNDTNNVGDIQGPGKMVVGPNSIHPNGGVYKIINNSPLVTVTRDQLVMWFEPYMVVDKKIQRSISFADSERNEFNQVVSISDVVSVVGLHQQGDEYFGSHPVHGSKGGANFWVNPSKNAWHCFRHDTGGGPLLLLAVIEGIIQCEDAVPGALKGKIFKKVLKKYGVK